MNRLVCSILLPLLSLFVPLFGSVTQQIKLQSEKHEVTVRLVLVDVIVTDQKGNFLSDLTLEDFEIFEQGKKMPINSLDLIRSKKPAQDPSQEENKERSAASNRENRFIVIFDSINTVKRMLDKSRPQIIEKLLSIIKLGQEIMLFELNETEGMKILQPWTSSETLITQAVNTASGNIWVDKSADTLSIPHIFAVQDAIAPGFLEKIQNALRNMYQKETRQRFEKTISGLLSVMNVIKDYSGRKPVLFISGGIPSLSFDKVGDADIALSEVSAAKINDPFKVLQKSGLRRGSQIFNDLIQFANSHNITFYTLDPDFFITHVLPDMAYDNNPRNAYSMSDFNSMGIFATDEIQEIKKNELTNLNTIAKETGGQSLQGGNKFEQFQNVINRDLSFYYELSYTPQQKKADGKYHDITVKVKRPQAKVSFRKGYYDYSAQQKEALLFSSAVSNPTLFRQIPFQAQALPFFKKNNSFVLWINMVLPVKDLILSSETMDTIDSLKAQVWVENPEKAKAFSAEFRIPIYFTPSFLQDMNRAKYFGFSTCSQEIKVRPDNYQVVFALYNDTLGEMGTFESQLEVPDLKGQKEILIAASVFGRLRERKDGLTPSYSISQKDGTLDFQNYKFFPMGTNQFGQNEQVALFVQVFSPETKLQQKPQISIYKDKNKIGEIPVETVGEEWDRKTKIQNMVVRLNFTSIPKGDYILEMILPNKTDPEKPAQKNLLIKIL
ncbi:MAG: VWA domain-containing protein [Candidatus Aminicenantes bacterium]|nr:VWA domain-containing protein [Candidatus Aminicenantes bacterium]